jgi:hypothetical protein
MMHRTRMLNTTIALAVVLLIGSAASAETIFIGASGGALDEPTNWSNGLPSSSNLGIIDAGKKARVTSGVTYAGYHIDLQTGGEIDGTGLGSGILSGGEFTINGGTLSAFRGVDPADGQIITLTTGLWNLNDSDVDLQGPGTIVNLNGGTVADGGGGNKGFTVHANSVLNINGGSVGASDGYLKHIGGNISFQGTGGTANFYGGDSYFSELRGTHSSGGLMVYEVLGASGSINAQNIGSYGERIQIDWGPGTGMSMTIANYAAWGETEWDAGRLTYDGQDTGDLGTWAEVTAPGGLGGGESFSYDSGTNTLTLIVPEPASFGMAFVGLMLVGLRRRRLRS